MRKKKKSMVELIFAHIIGVFMNTLCIMFGLFMINSFCVKFADLSFWGYLLLAFFCYFIFDSAVVIPLQIYIGKKIDN